MSDWSPYALERYRVTKTRGPSRWLLALLALLVLGWLTLNFFAGDSSVQVGTGDSGSVAVTAPNDPGPPKATVKIQPGKVTELDAPVEAGSQGSQAQQISTERPYPIIGGLLLIAPLLLIPWFARRLIARPSKVELNFGVYKGAMPLEMISASQREILFSRGVVENPLFGKTRGDYVKED